DFNAPSHLVRPDLWDSADGYSTGEAGSGEMDMLRIIDGLIFPTPNPKLLIVRHFVVQLGATSARDQDGLTARNTPSPIAGRADVKMILCILSTAGWAQAGGQFYGFNDGSSTAPSDATGDIVTRLRISCTSTNQAAITWNVWRCTDSACANSTSLGTGSFGAVDNGQEFTLNVPT